MLMYEMCWDEAQQIRRSESRQEERERILGKALAEGYSLEVIHDITGLDMETLKNLQEEE